MSSEPVQSVSVPVRPRTAYQFPVYRWIGWLAVAGFVIGLTAMFFIAGMIGWPAPMLWASVVILFSFGALLLDRPRSLLAVMMFYFLLIPSNRLLGILPVPLLGRMNKYFFIPFLAVIVMNWIQRRQLKEATVFPLAFLCVTGLSWYVNGRPSMLTTIQITMVMMRLYILWYFCRLTSTFENERQMLKWVWGFVIYVAAQYFYNVVWQQGFWLRSHPDRSGGVFGPFSQGGAHLVGYLCVFALLLIVGWWIGARSPRFSRQRKWMVLMGIVIAYNLIFMTDTKHALLMIPIAFAPFLFHPRFSRQLKLGLFFAGSLFLVASFAYLQTSTGRRDLQRYWDAFLNSPKAKMFYAVTTDFNHLVAYPIFGAGPGQFASDAGVEGRSHLARRYVIPYEDENRRLGYLLRSGSVVSASIVGNPRSDVLILAGEYGWAGVVVFWAFWFWVVYRLVRKSFDAPPGSFRAGILLALACCLIFQAMIMSLTTLLILPAMTYPIWMLVGRIWDMPDEEPERLEAA
jgi:Na+-transporting methylmalonyl-CoA/oxaloacetate decarboxylase gamma subunit